MSYAGQGDSSFMKLTTGGQVVMSSYLDEGETHAPYGTMAWLTTASDEPVVVTGAITDITPTSGDVSNLAAFIVTLTGTFDDRRFPDNPDNLNAYIYDITHAGGSGLGGYVATVTETTVSFDLPTTDSTEPVLNGQTVTIAIQYTDDDTDELVNVGTAKFHYL